MLHHIADCNCRAKEDVVVLGVHDLRFSSTQTIPVDEVVNLPQDGSFPPKLDLSLLRLSVPARISMSIKANCIVCENPDFLRLCDVTHCLPVSQAPTCVQSVSLTRTKSSMTAGPVLQRAGEPQKQQVIFKQVTRSWFLCAEPLQCGDKNLSCLKTFHFSSESLLSMLSDEKRNVFEQDKSSCILLGTPR